MHENFVFTKSGFQLEVNFYHDQREGMGLRKKDLGTEGSLKRVCLHGGIIIIIIIIIIIRVDLACDHADEMFVHEFMNE